MQPDQAASPSEPSRRSFMKGSTAALVAGAVAGELSIARSAHAKGDSSPVPHTLRIGLIGCGGRGNGAAVQALKADKDPKQVAMGGLFPDQVNSAVGILTKEKNVGDRVDVPKERQFAGWDAYQKVIDSGVDLVLLAAPPQFRPLHMQAAIAAGKHVFAEKPVAVAAPGVHKVLAAAKQAKDKNLALCSGLCWRYDFGARASFEQVREGAIGDVIAIEANYNSIPPGKPWPMIRDK